MIEMLAQKHRLYSPVIGLIIALLAVVGCNENPRRSHMKGSLIIEEGDFRDQVTTILKKGNTKLVEMADVPPDAPQIGETYQLPSGQILYLTFAPHGEEKSDYVLANIDVCPNPEQPKVHRKIFPVERFSVPVE